MAFERLLRLTKKCPGYVVSRLRNAKRWYSNCHSRVVRKPILHQPGSFWHPGTFCHDIALDAMVYILINQPYANQLLGAKQRSPLSFYFFLLLCDCTSKRKHMLFSLSFIVIIIMFIFSTASYHCRFTVQCSPSHNFWNCCF